MTLDSQIMVTMFGIGCFTVGVILGARLNSMAHYKPKKHATKQKDPQKAE